MKPVDEMTDDEISVEHDRIRRLIHEAMADIGVERKTLEEQLKSLAGIEKTWRDAIKEGHWWKLTCLCEEDIELLSECHPEPPSSLLDEEGTWNPR